MKYKIIPGYSLNEIEEITLLSSKEWERVSKITTVPKFMGCWWWLRSPGYGTHNAAYAYDDGDVDYYGFDANGSGGCVRPAFKIQNLKLKIGSKLFVQNTLCTVINSFLVLSDTLICQHRFDANSNDYEESEIKRFLNSDELKKML